MNGKRVDVKNSNFKIIPKPKDKTFNKIFSDVFKSKEEDILNFPYEKSIILCEKNFGNFANKIVEYFRFWYKYGSDKQEEILIPVRSIDEKSYFEYKIIIKEDKNFEKRLNGKNL